MAQRVRKGLANWLTSSTTPIFVLDHRRVLLVFNQGCIELTGREAADVIGKTCLRTTNPNPELIESLTGVLAPPERVFQGEIATVPAVIPTATKPETVEIYFFPLSQEQPDDQIRIVGVIGPLKDSGIELVPDSEVRRFELAQVLNSIYENHQIKDLVASSPEMQRVATQVAVAQDHTHPVHFIGETGVGKEYLARLIHYSSSSKERRFLPLDCQNLSHFEISRILSRLFVEPSDETQVGTVYLQQIEYLARDLQVELLEHINSGSIFRWMSNSRRSLEALTEEEMLKELQATFAAFQISVPPLRNRNEDVLLLATHFLELLNIEHKKSVEQFSADVETELCAYRWPGNVNELYSVVKESVDRCQSNVIQAEELNLQFKTGRDAQRTRPVRVGESLEDYLNRVERERISDVLKTTGGNKKAAAEILQLTRPKLYRRMQALEIEETQNQAEATS